MARCLRRVTVERRGDRGMHASALIREQVRGERGSDLLVTDPVRCRRGPISRACHRHREPLSQRLLEPGRKIAVEHARAAPNAVRSSTRRQAQALLVRGSNRGELVERKRAFREGEGTQDAAAVGGPVRKAAEDELRERGRERRPGELPSGVEHLLDDERVPPRPLGDQQEERRGGSLALVDLDQR
ncbi:MAG TPA: hypothetical protein VF400_09470, partial [Anaeromyxobacteraceae bacterium]